MWCEVPHNSSVAAKCDVLCPVVVPPLNRFLNMGQGRSACVLGPPLYSWWWGGSPWWWWWWWWRWWWWPDRDGQDSGITAKRLLQQSILISKCAPLLIRPRKPWCLNFDATLIRRRENFIILTSSPMMTDYYLQCDISTRFELFSHAANSNVLSHSRTLKISLWSPTYLRG